MFFRKRRVATPSRQPERAVEIGRALIRPSEVASVERMSFGSLGSGTRVTLHSGRQIELGTDRDKTARALGMA